MSNSRHVLSLAAGMVALVASSAMAVAQVDAKSGLLPVSWTVS